MSTTTEAAAWPRATATLNEDGTAQVSIGGTATEIAAGDVDEARAQVVAIVAARAEQLGRPLHVLTRDPAGEWPLIIHPDQTVTEDDSREARPQAPEPAAEPVTQQAEADQPDAAVAGPGSWVTAAAAAPAAALPTRRAMRQSFLVREQIEEPATTGWRGLVTRAGIRMSPSEEERAERADVLAVSQHWPGPRTIAIVNGKGGAGKTPSTVLLSGVFARYGGAGVLAWDNNQTRGTLGWRTEQGPHESTLLELLPQVDRLLSTSAQSADLAHYVHHQTRDRFDVLRSKPMALAQEQRIEPEDVDAIHAVASKYYRLIFIDSGNDESDPMWRRMIDHADQLVVATTTRDDHAEAGALLLEALADRDERSARLADNAVVVVTQADPKATAADMQRVAAGYRDITREAVTIPFDQAMVDGVLHYGALRPSTQRAWLAAAAAVARGL
ncbi:AAA family ATPase [uncultured Leifsonia sp.]|uniref:MinD/ParA family ATP-binding protein n=1 Tax=uncultured Leifsonia sp. TaxID=340359 RepID=UPI0025CEAA55|nr:AAA family ATPase [uncultured Leifsonia sp.]